MLGTARSAEFRDRAGRRRAAANLVARGIDRLVVIGGDGSLSGADVLRAEWPSLLAELVEAGELDQETADRHPVLALAGLVGSIDNDMVGTETTIGADSALHRIVEALDAIGSTASSHQRSFVVEVMGRRCGYLALAAALAAGADYVLIPERPPQPGWEDDLCELVRAGRAAGRRNSVVVVAEGAHDSANDPITSAYVRTVLEERLGEDTRVTILGHVQRGGVPSAYDRWMSAILGSRRGRRPARGDPGDRPAAGRGPRQPCPHRAAARGRHPDPRAGRPDHDPRFRHGAEDARRRLHRDGATVRVPLASAAGHRPGSVATLPDRGAQRRRPRPGNERRRARGGPPRPAPRPHHARRRRELPRPGRRAMSGSWRGATSRTGRAQAGRSSASAATSRRSRTSTRSGAASSGTASTAC